MACPECGTCCVLNFPILDDLYKCTFLQCDKNKLESCLWSELRINQSVVVPVKYDLTIQVNLTTNHYNGSVAILVDAKSEFQTIVLHAADMLTVGLVSVTAVEATGGTRLAEATIFRHRPNHYVVVEFQTNQPSGKYELNFNFSASLLDAGLSGLYLSNYTDAGQQYKIASTQFEFYDARKVFPCFDEPALKSTFVVTIVHDAAMNTTLSNMEIDSEKKIEERQWVETRFKESERMTTYLVAMLVSDFVCIHQESNKVRYGVCASRVQQHKMDYALEKAPLCLQHLEQV